jgi:hypothetical protein
MCGACCILHNIILDHDCLDNWENCLHMYRFKRSLYTVNISAVQVSYHRMVDDILYNHDGKNAPGPYHTNKYEDYFANDDTDHAMTHRLRYFIKHYYLAK